MKPSEYETIQPLADQIYAVAASLKKPDRHTISDAAQLIQWICYLAAFPDDAEALAAVKRLRAALSEIKKPGSN